MDKKSKKSTRWKFAPSSTATIRCKGGPDCCLAHLAAFKELPFTHFHVPLWEPPSTWRTIKRKMGFLLLIPFIVFDFLFNHDYLGVED